MASIEQLRVSGLPQLEKMHHLDIDAWEVCAANGFASSAVLRILDNLCDLNKTCSPLFPHAVAKTKLQAGLPD